MVVIWQGPREKHIGIYWVYLKISLCWAKDVPKNPNVFPMVCKSPKWPKVSRILKVGHTQKKDDTHFKLMAKKKRWIWKTWINYIMPGAWLKILTTRKSGRRRFEGSLFHHQTHPLVESGTVGLLMIMQAIFLIPWTMVFVSNPSQVGR